MEQRSYEVTTNEMNSTHVGKVKGDSNAVYGSVNGEAHEILKYQKIHLASNLRVRASSCFLGTKNTVNKVLSCDTWLINEKQFLLLWFN